MAFIPQSGSVVAFQGNPSVLQALVTVTNPVTVSSISGTVGASIIGLPPVNVVGRPSISGTVNIAGNPSISGTVLVGNTNVNVSGSVAAWLQSTDASIITIGTAVPNQSVSGTVDVGNFPTNQNVSGSVVAFQGTPQWTVRSSITGGIFPVSGSVAAVIVGTPNVNTAGSVVAFQGTTPWANTNVGSIITVSQDSSVVAYQLAGSILATSATVLPGSVSGAITAPPGSIMAVAGAVTAPAGSIATVVHPAGSVSGVRTDNTSVITVWKDSSVITYQLAGSILATSASITPAENQSVSGTVNIGNFPTSQNVSGSVVAFQGTSPWLTNQGGSVIAVFQSSSIIARVTGSVATLGIAGSIMSVTAPAGSVATVIATAPAGSIMATNQVAGSVMAVATGSVAAWLQSNNASVITVVSAGAISVGSVSGAVTAPPGSVSAVRTDNASVIAISTNVGSVITIQQANSIVGTYVEDAAYATGDRGLFFLAMRNDLMASITSADLDYSGVAVGPVGEAIVANAPITKWVQGTASMLGGLPTTGVAVPIIATGGTSVFTYITGLQITNPSANNAFIRLIDSGGATLGFTIAPANGGSNIYFANALKTAANTGFSASVNTVASVYLSAQGFVAKA